MSKRSRPDLDDVTVELLRSILTYDEKSGILTWLPRPDCNATWNSRYANRPAGTINHAGYVQLSIYKRLVRAHRIGWALHYRAWPDGILDHVDGNPTNNRIDNLRLATVAQNGYNAKRQSRNKSGKRGVFWCDHKERWIAEIHVNRKRIYLACTSDRELAVQARRDAEIRYHGAFRRDT